MQRVVSVALSAVVASVLVFAGAAAAAFTKTAAPAEAKFNGAGTGGFKIEGKTNAVDVKDDDKNITVTVQLKDLATGIALRDSHMKDKYLEVQKFPETVLVVAKDALKIPENGAEAEGDAKGSYTLHGVTKERTFHYKGTCSKDGVCDVTGTMPVNFNDHGVVVPKYLGITVKPDVTVTTRFQVKR